MCLGDGSHDRQAETRLLETSPCTSATDEALEHMRPVLGRDAGAGVADPQDEVSTASTAPERDFVMSEPART